MFFNRDDWERERADRMIRIARTGLWVLAFAACSGRVQLNEYTPEQAVQPERVFARGEAEMIRFVTADSAVHTLFRARLVRDTVIGTRDAGPPRRVPSDSIAYIEAYIAAGSRGVSAGEWFRVGLLAAFIGAMGVCASGVCSP